MRTALPLAVLLGLSFAPAAGAQPVVRLGVDAVAGYHGYTDTDLSFGAAGLVHARTPGRWAGYGALRPELTARTVGGTGFLQDLDVLYYGDDGLPVYSYGTCRSTVTGDASPGSCGATVLSVALSGELGARREVGGGAVSVGLGGRVGRGAGVYGALTGRLAAPVYGRVEVGTGHVMVGLGLGDL